MLNVAGRSESKDVPDTCGGLGFEYTETLPLPGNTPGTRMQKLSVLTVESSTSSQCIDVTFIC